MPALTWLSLPGPHEQWAALGFATDPFVVGGVAIEVGAEGGWGFDAVPGDPASLGVPTLTKPVPAPGPAHPNRADRVDHVVYAVLRLDTAIDDIGAALGIEPRRRGVRGESEASRRSTAEDGALPTAADPPSGWARPREQGPEMAFFRVGPCVLEVVEAGAGPLLWGVAFGSPSLDATVAAVREAGGEIGDPKPSIQGGRIASVPKRYLDVPVAFMEAPHGHES